LDSRASERRGNLETFWRRTNDKKACPARVSPVATESQAFAGSGDKQGSRNGCGNAVFVADGFIGSSHVGLTSDGVSRLYFSLSGPGQVFRYTPTTGAVTPVSSGFAFAAGHTNTLTLDSFGNLWVGDDPSDVNFSGRLWRIPAASLAAIP